MCTGDDTISTKSFFEDMVIDTPEAIANLEEAYDKAEHGRGIRPRDVRICRDPVFINRLMEKATRDQDGF